jgi:hypothetical protein
VHQERDDGADEENHEKDFRNACSAGGESAETEDCSNQSNDQKDDGIVKHVSTRLVTCADCDAITIRLPSALKKALAAAA